MNSTHICLQLFGTKCNEWPRFRVIGNSITYFDSEVCENATIEFDMPLLDNNTLIIQHYDKKFGENGQWDTKCEGDQIIEDRAVRLVKLEIDSVDITKYFVRHWTWTTTDGTELTTDYFGHNGQACIEFTAPVYNWIITKLVHDPETSKYKAQDLIIETSHSDLFNYTQDIIELAEIEKILKENAHLFSKSS